MQNMEEFSGSNDHMIVKGKRTKRPRPSSSSASSSDISTCTEEDEDMANCLILLASGGVAAEDNKLTGSRKFTEMAKVGIYVYECKTCNRTFPSFQALGGHRASHKRPKANFDPKISPRQDQDEEIKIKQCTRVNTIPPLPSTNNKIHECLICGAEFASGQALGGHMRRHRPAGATTTTTTTTNNNNYTRIGTSIDNDSISSHEVGKTRSVMSLDLNLPAPTEDDSEGGGFIQFSSQRLVFSAVPLVDCHY